jgi:hypothetical protein
MTKPKAPVTVLFAGSPPKLDGSPPDFTVTFAEPESSGVAVIWQTATAGFGGFYFYRDKDGGPWKIGNEMMSKEFIKQVFCKMVDDAELDS